MRQPHNKLAMTRFLQFMITPKYAFSHTSGLAVKCRAIYLLFHYPIYPRAFDCYAWASLCLLSADLLTRERWMTMQNPYAAPRASLESANHSGGCFRSGKTLIVPYGADLPPRCVKCNAPAATPIKARDFFWHAQGWYLSLLMGPIIYLLVALAVRKRARLSVGLCSEHLAKRTKLVLAAWGAIFLGIAGVMVGASMEMPALALIGGGLGFVGIILAIIAARLLLPARIDTQHVRLDGASAAFLNSLPGR
jgi:hypothetical protein